MFYLVVCVLIAWYSCCLVCLFCLVCCLRLYFVLLHLFDCCLLIVVFSWVYLLVYFNSTATLV